MAEVRRRLGSGALGFTHKLNPRYLVINQQKQSKSVSCVSAGLLLEDFGAAGPEDPVTVGVSPDGYTRVTTPSGTFNRVDIPGSRFYNGLESFPASSFTYKRNPLEYKRTIRFRRTFTGVQGLFLGPGPVVFVRSYTRNGSEPLYKTQTGYYDILEVTSSATQAQIKTAYYKQSFVYHPDRNSGSEEATVRFSEINEAYTVLGNKALRKKYDRGLLSLSDLTATVKPSGRDPTTAGGGSSKQHPGMRGSAAGSGVQGSVSDVDSFLKRTYYEQLQRQKEIRVRREEKTKKKEIDAQENFDRLAGFGVVAMLAAAILLLMSLGR